MELKIVFKYSYPLAVISCKPQNVITNRIMIPLSGSFSKLNFTALVFTQSLLVHTFYNAPIVQLGLLPK